MTTIPMVISQLRVALPGRVEKTVVRDGTLLADVKPLIKRVRFEDGEEIPLPVIPNVPVMFPRTGRARLTFPVQPGDKGQLIVNDRSIDNYLDSGEDSLPLELRTHDLTDACFYPGFYEIGGGAEYDTSNLVLELDGAAFVVNSGGRVAVGGPIGNPAAAELLDIVNRLLQALQTAVVNTSLGPQPLDPATQTVLTQLVAELSTIKGALP